MLPALRELSILLGGPEAGDYRTALGDTIVGPWLRLASLPGRELAINPRTSNAADKAAGVVLARGAYEDALALAARENARLPFRSELTAAAQELRLAAFIAQPIETMRTRAAAAAFDRAMEAATGNAFPARGVLYAKTWVIADEDPEGRWTAEGGRIDKGGRRGRRHAPEWGGWTKAGEPSSMIQKDYGAHDVTHVDYAMVPSLVRVIR